MDGVLPANEETYQQIHTEADRLSRLVDDLQEPSRVEARAYPLDVRSLDVSTLVQTVAKRLVVKAQAKRISPSIRLTPASHLFALAKVGGFGQSQQAKEKGAYSTSHCQ